MLCCLESDTSSATRTTTPSSARSATSSSRTRRTSGITAKLIMKRSKQKKRCAHKLNLHFIFMSNNWGRRPIFRQSWDKLGFNVLAWVILMLSFSKSGLKLSYSKLNPWLQDPNKKERKKPPTYECHMCDIPIKFALTALRRHLAR